MRGVGSIVRAKNSTRRHALLGIGVTAALATLSSCSMPLELSNLATPKAPALRVASFNIQYLDLTRNGQNGKRSLESWEDRKLGVLSVVRRIDPDILAFQEMESWAGAPQNGSPVQRTWLSSQMPDYAFAACTCADGLESGQPIFFRRSRFTLSDYGTQTIGSVIDETLEQVQIRTGAFAGYSDLVSWVSLFDLVTGAALTVVNTHMHFSNQLRQEGAAQLAVRIARMAMERGDRVVVLGDMNVLALAPPITVLRAGGLTLVPSEGASFHFNNGLHAFGAIDHILHGPSLMARDEAQIVRGQFKGIWPSDHYPVWVDLHPI